MLSGIQASAGRPSVHFMGIGGTGMVGGARLAIEAGWEVRGSDRNLYAPTSHLVVELGVPVALSYAAENLDWSPGVVVIGNALSRGNVEVETALERRLHYLSLPEWMKEVVLRKRRPIVITGTHGKTTTAAITAYLLKCAGIDPGYFIGGLPLDFAHSARLGPEGGAFVIEGDEYDSAFFDKRAKFFHYLPETAVVTSIEFDHGDIYRDLAEIELSFQRMLRQLPSDGDLILCADAPGALALRDHSPCAVTTYGTGPEAEWRLELESVEKGFQLFTIYKGGESWLRVRSPLAGRHNALNALAAIVASTFHGATKESIRRSLPEFKGIRRRMEVFHRSGGITFVDDFAHHPTAIRESIAAVRTRRPGRVIVLFEPRSNTTVTNRFQSELEEAFHGADEVWIGPIHRPEAIPESMRLDRDALAKSLRDDGVVAHIAMSADAIVGELPGCLRKDDLVLIVSNGAFDGINEKIEKAFPDIAP